MKRIRITLCLLLGFFGAAAFAQNLNVASFNIRNDNQGDVARGNAWSKRCPWICGLIRFEGLDILGAQEVLHGQLKDMQDLLPAYDWVGVGRDDGATAGEYEPIFYKRERFCLQDSGHFWLSEHPERPGLGWDAACVRICTWVRLHDSVTDKGILFLNLHMDHVGVVARRESAKLVMSRIAAMKKEGETVFVTGDFNVDQTNEIYSIFTGADLLEDSFVTAQDKYAPSGTPNGFDPASFTHRRIDHVFVSTGLPVLKYAVLTETWRGDLDGSDTYKTGDFPKEVDFQRKVPRTLSDHFPVIIKVKL